jgi:hypothetical protein
MAGSGVHFSVAAMVRGYHVYRDIWAASIGEELPCECQEGNRQDAYAVAVKKNGNIVGHVPWKISTTSFMFLRRGGSILCQVTESQRYSADLPQGGLEIPCILVFTGSAKEVSKVAKLVSAALPSVLSEVSSDHLEVQQPRPSKVDTVQTVYEDEDFEVEMSKNGDWVQCQDIVLSKVDRDIISNGQKLTDRHINYAQRLLKRQFPLLNGLKLSLCQMKEQSQEERLKESKLQIFHTRGDHWTVASTIHSVKGQVKIYDSIYNSMDSETTAVIMNLFQVPPHPLQVDVHVKVQKQEDTHDCGLFAIAVATAEAFNSCSSPQGSLRIFEQDCMRAHLTSRATSSALRKENSPCFQEKKHY